MSIDVRDFEPRDHEWAARLIGDFQGGDRMVARLGELIDPLTCPGIVAERDGTPVGVLVVVESDRGLEVLALMAAQQRVGIGTRLLETALRVAAASKAPRLWLVTTNDNLPAIRFYLSRGMRVATVHEGGVTSDRAAIKPGLPETGHDGIPIRDYVELEIPIDGDADALQLRGFPDIADVDALPPEAAADALGPLFESAPRFLARLVAKRPFGDDASLIEKAHDLARTIPEEEQIELLDAHPRIGADPATVSELSHAEQGYDDEDDEGDEGEDGEPVVDAQPWIAEELEMLNEAYERIFGFRFVVFVAGRPRSEIVPILERSLRDDRVAELRRGLDDVVYIAADRLANLRSTNRESFEVGDPSVMMGR
jgi:2-oxo-4-hydroxy-4-carboxy--5-ureidoimidazoline (OHCU) decarboxylase/GNAT superfamily N-acetyltransferase